jgi:hypothetical protein
MAANYSLQGFIEDLERITRTETSPERIVGAAKPLAWWLLRGVGPRQVTAT